ncbi:polyphosphate polymerase domain-containing protein [Bailinhaonella thermotolerans]|uniref:polyphosphate polymerase domain-containing protein n=1 Tax=Bailinhaonella thermotolerans TaxID=1070861 RepID=UPI001F5B8E72|nr:polyphosphate polymerase domain-containing protein [Bailinhaonella thermotolerans]
MSAPDEPLDDPLDRPLDDPLDRPLDRLLDGLPPVSLARVRERAELQTRLDRKYLVPVGAFAELIGLAGREYGVLEIGGLRRFRYSSTYFDTPGLLTYRGHVQGRRRRFKVRTRSYLDSGACMFEVKLNGARDSTDKHRMPYDIERRAELTPRARAFLAATLRKGYGEPPPEDLGPVATTTYARATLVHLAGTGRVTCDTGLVCADGTRRAAAGNGHMLLESKSPGPETPVDRLLRRLGVRPLSLSKYCVAVAVLRPSVTAAPWLPVLRRLFPDPPAESLLSGSAPGRGRR